MTNIEDEKFALGERIKKRRVQLGMSQLDLAILSGYKSKSSINKIELGYVDLPRNKIQDMADALKTTPQYLMGWKNDSMVTYSETFSQRVGKQIENRMNEVGLTKMELARRCEIPFSALEDMINGKNRYFSRDLLVRFCDVLNVQLNYFMFSAEPVENIGLNMKAIREISGVKKEQIAKWLECSFEEYEAIENGDPVTFEYIEKFANYYCMPTGTIIGDNYENLRNDPRIKRSLHSLARCNEWNDIVGVVDLTDDELDKILDYAKYIVSKRNEKI